MSSKSALLLIAKNERRYLLDWIAYHRAIGFDGIFVYDNQSDDGSREMLDKLGHFVTVIDWPNTSSQDRQASAYKHWLNNFGVQFDWVMPMDADEYLVLIRHPSVNDFLNDYPDADGLAINWRVFGDSGLQKADGRPIFVRFTRAAFQDFGANHLPKSISRVKSIVTLGIHTPKLRDGAVFISPDRILRKQLPSARQDSVDHSVAQVNHYFGKTWEEWEGKRNRGRATKAGGAVDAHRSDGTFHWHNRNDESDTSAWRFLDQFQTQRKALEAAVTQSEREATSQRPDSSSEHGGGGG